MSQPRTIDRGARTVDLAGIAGLLLLSAAVYLAVVRPMVQERNELASLRHRCVELRDQSGALDATAAVLQSHLERVRDEMASSRVKLEPESAVNRRTAQIVEQAGARGLVIQESKMEEAVRGTWHTTVPFVLAGQGGFSDCAAFLHWLATSLPDVEVVRFELSGKPERDAAPSRFRFHLAWYAAPQEP